MHPADDLNGNLSAGMKRCSLLLLVLALVPLESVAQVSPALGVQVFTTAADVALPYDMKLLQTQLVAELTVLLGKEFHVVADSPASAQGSIYQLNAEVTSWRAGNVAKRLLVGLGSGREALDLHYRVTDSSGKAVVERKDTIRTNFYSQGSGSSGTLAHPIAQKLAERIKNANLK